MKLTDAFGIAEEANKLTGLRDLVVIGSNAALALEPHTDLPLAMSISADLDAYLRNDPNRTGTLASALGEGSAYHRRTGVFLDVVSPALVTAPDDWESRLLKVTRGRLTLWFLDPCDAAVSKLARGEPRDLRWVEAGLDAALISPAVLRHRMHATRFLDEQEQAQAFERLETLCSSDRRLAESSQGPDLGF